MHSAHSGMTAHVQFALSMNRNARARARGGCGGKGWSYQVDGGPSRLVCLLRSALFRNSSFSAICHLRAKYEGHGFCAAAHAKTSAG